MTLETHADLREFARLLAKHNIERDGSQPASVAQTAIVGVARVGDENALRFNAEPYLDRGEGPSGGERVWPKDVIQAYDGELPPTTERTTSLRPLAVQILAAEIDAATRELTRGESP